MLRQIERKYRNARIWSNRELEKIAPLCNGDVINVSAWRDQDKEGRCYKEYFSNARSYSISNYHESSARGYQEDLSGQLILDLEQKLSAELQQHYDVVFNHTVLEHTFNCQLALENLCNMSRDMIILVVPFLQETHADYGDYWRFTPQGVDCLFKHNGYTTAYYSCNDQGKDSIYLFFVATRSREVSNDLRDVPGNQLDSIYTRHVGTRLVYNSIIDRIYNKVVKYFVHPTRRV